jgi:hypothetical protein
LLRLVHIINPTNVSESSDLYKAQSITIQSIDKAKSFSRFFDQIELVYTHFSEEKVQLPSHFKQLAHLNNSIHDFHEDGVGKKLPLIGEILSKVKTCQPTYVVYTNMDIVLMPHFYDTLFGYIALGHDAVVINRRRISSSFIHEKDLSEMYAEIGFSHPGFDCFAFHVNLIDKFITGNICVGIPFVEATLVYNISAFAQNPLYVDDKHLTFHIGLEVMPPRNKTYYKHNRSEFFNNILPKLYPQLSIKKLPYAALPFPIRAIKWVLNPTMFTRLFILLELKSFLSILHEIRWRILQR